MITFYHQIKTSINFWYRQGLNPRSLIQPSEILPIELIGTHMSHGIFIASRDLKLLIKSPNIYRFWRFS